MSKLKSQEDLIMFLEDREMYNKESYYKEPFNEDKFKNIGKRAAAINNKLYKEQREEFMKNSIDKENYLLYTINNKDNWSNPSEDE